MKTVKKKKDGRAGFHASELLVLQRGKIASLPIAFTLLSINDVIISLYIRHHVVKQN